jgi:dTDP-4-amino-4,6-dideoxygalactose transaminase
MRAFLNCTLGFKVGQGPELEQFYRRFGDWLGTAHVFGAASGRSAFQLALEALGLEQGQEIIFPAFTFPVMPMVAKMMGYRPVFCDVDQDTYNSGPEHIAPCLTDRTGAVLATHLFGRPCAIEAIAELAERHDIRLMEDCAHACGVRIGDRHVGTYGDIGLFSFAEGKNMPCLAGGAIITSDDAIAERAQAALDRAQAPPSFEVVKKALGIWGKWFFTRPTVFALTVYPVLRMKQWLGMPLMDSAVGDELLEQFEASNPKIERLVNLQAAVGLRQLYYIDAFNEGARNNARILTDMLSDTPGIGVPRSKDGNHIYVYYPLTVAPTVRDDLRQHLLSHGIDAKITDMSDCAQLAPFRPSADGPGETARNGTREASILEICVYPIIPEKSIRRLGRIIDEWARAAVSNKNAAG